MFTGIVQEVGKIVARFDVSRAAGDAVRFSIEAPGISGRLAIGDSVACDGVCLTVETLLPSGFTVCAVPETLAKTTLALWAEGGIINLETALTASTPLGGHFVLGHADGVCEVVETRPLGPNQESGCELTVRLPAEFMPYCVYKGSICLQGVSLTIAGVEEDRVRVALIPHTLEVTTLKLAVPRGRLNFEVDILAKHVERQLAARLGGASRVAPANTGEWGHGVS
jgi:riboflavin synthase